MWHCHDIVVIHRDVVTNLCKGHFRTTNNQIDFFSLLFSISILSYEFIVCIDRNARSLAFTNKETSSGREFVAWARSLCELKEACCQRRLSHLLPLRPLRDPNAFLVAPVVEVSKLIDCELVWILWVYFFVNKEIDLVIYSWVWIGFYLVVICAWSYFISRFVWGMILLMALQPLGYEEFLV